MALTGNWVLVQYLVMIILYKLLRLVFITVQRIYWQLNGTARKLRQARLPHNYERSAQVLDVVLSIRKYITRKKIHAEDFLGTHNRFENPQYIIDNENITLLTFTNHDAIFCETEEKGTLLTLQVQSNCWQINLITQYNGGFTSPCVTDKPQCNAHKFIKYIIVCPILLCSALDRSIKSISPVSDARSPVSGNIFK